MSRRLLKSESALLKKIFDEIETPTTYKNLYDKFHEKLGYEVYKNVRGIRLSLNKYYSKEEIKQKIKYINYRHENAMKIGEVKVSKQNTRGGKPRYQIKLENGRSKDYHIYLWERVNGKIPKGHCLVALNGDYSSSDLSNYKLVKVKTVLYMSHYKRDNQIDLYGKGVVTEASLEIFETEILINETQ